MKTKTGFTLIEVLLALMVIAIGVTALLKTITLDIHTSNRIQEKTVQHLVAMNAISQLQMNIFHTTESSTMLTQSTLMMGQTWYWRAVFKPTPVRTMQHMTVSVSQHQAGPYTSPLIAYRYLP